MSRCQSCLASSGIQFLHKDCRKNSSLESPGDYPGLVMAVPDKTPALEEQGTSRGMGQDLHTGIRNVGWGLKIEMRPDTRLCCHTESLPCMVLHIG